MNRSKSVNLSMVLTGILFSGVLAHAQSDLIQDRMSGCTAISQGIENEVASLKEERTDVLIKNIQNLSSQAMRAEATSSEKAELMKAIIAETKKMTAIEAQERSDLERLGQENKTELDQFCN